MMTQKSAISFELMRLENEYKKTINIDKTRASSIRLNMLRLILLKRKLG